MLWLAARNGGVAASCRPRREESGKAWGRGRGLQALTAPLSAWPQAALDFVVEEDLKAHLTCWYLQKYVKENPLPQYLERLQP